MLTKFEAQLAAHLLDMAGDEFGNHGCTDFNLIEKFDLKAQDLIDLDRMVEEWNGTPTEHDASRAIGGRQDDWVLMNYMADRLTEEANGGVVSVIRPAAEDMAGEWRRLAVERWGRVEHLERDIKALCSVLGITREDVEKLVGNGQTAYLGQTAHLTGGGDEETKRDEEPAFQITVAENTGVEYLKFEPVDRDPAKSKEVDYYTDDSIGEVMIYTGGRWVEYRDLVAENRALASGMDALCSALGITRADAVGLAKSNRSKT